jgi:hypothetical protein
MEKEYANLFSLTFWKAYWVTMRPYLLFISGSAGIAGFVEGPEINSEMRNLWRRK